MKNNLALIIISSLVFAGIIFGLSDYARIRNANMPMFMFLLKSEGNQNFYYGLGYKLIRTSNTNFDDINNDIKDEFGLWFYTKEIEIKQKDYVYAINVKESDTSDFKFYFEDDLGFKYFIAGIDTIEINDGEIKSLKQALERKKLTMDAILDNATLEKFYSNGKDLYTIKDNLTNETVKILKDTENNQYYIGLENIDFERVVYDKIISKEYTILNLERSKENNYLFLTLKDNELDEVDTVKVLNVDSYNLKENNNYDFIFIEENTNDGTIESIFENSKLKEIKLVQN